MARKCWMAAIAAAVCLVVAPGRAAVISYETVSVGDAGNPNDSTGYGGVADEYRIGRYDVTIGQYTAFLNATAKTDTYGLYNTSMATNLNIAGIARTGSSGTYTYGVIGGSANRPITYVSWFDAARFANWMHNGQGSGSTETGAYTLTGGLTSGTAPGRNAGARFFIPTENEWYKSAYYSPNHGGFGVAGYHAYATQSDTAPGNIIGAGSNQANYVTGAGFSVTQSPTFSSSVNYLTDVGAYTNSASAYGTFDQSGSVFQWNDLDGVAGSSRGLRGGNWSGNQPFFLSSASRFTGAASHEGNNVGFRLASPGRMSTVPEVGSAGIEAALAFLAGGLGLLERRRRTPVGDPASRRRATVGTHHNHPCTS